jgi:glycerate dehydrogenase
MNDRKIVFTDVKTLGFNVNVSGLSRYGQVQLYDCLKDNEVAAAVSDADIIITNQNNLNESNLGGSDKLKLICAAATGYDNIDTAYCREKGVAVTNVPGYAAGSVAQHTFAMLLYLISHSRYYDDFVKDGTYSTMFPVNHENRDFFELEGKTWGIIGLGAIGRKVGLIAEGFGCHVIYYSTSGKNHDVPFKESMLDDLLRNSDIISVHAPLNRETRGLIGRTELGQMKKSSYLLNLGRGGIVSEEDLVYALENQMIAGAGLDVFENEPIRQDGPLMRHINGRPEAGVNLYLTPHIGYASTEARERLMSTICSNIEAFLAGNDLNRVDV